MPSFGSQSQPRTVQKELIDMMPDSDFRRTIATERLAELQRSAAPSRRVVRRHLGSWLVAAGTRLSPEARVAAPRRAAA